MNKLIRLTLLIVLLTLFSCMKDPYENQKGVVVEKKETSSSVTSPTSDSTDSKTKKEEVSPTQKNIHKAPKDVLPKTDFQLPPVQQESSSNGFGLGSLKLKGFDNPPQDDFPAMVQDPKNKGDDTKEDSTTLPTSAPATTKPSQDMGGKNLLELHKEPSNRLNDSPPELTIPSVLAKINDDVVEKEEFVQSIQAAAKLAKVSDVDSLPSSIKKQLYQKVLEQLILQKIIFQKAREKGIKGDSDYSQKMMGYFHSTYKAGQQGNSPFGNLSKEKALVLFKRQLIIQEYMKELSKEIEVNDSDLMDFYKKTIGKKKARVYQILVSSSDTDSKEEKAKALEKVALLKKWLQDKKADFQELSKKHSTGTAAGTNGDLGWVEEGDTLQALEKEIFSMTDEEIRGPIQSSQGYHFVKVTEIKNPVAFSLVKDKIAFQIRLKQIEGVLMKKALEAKKEATIQVFPSWAKAE